jgi:predicted porin
MKKILPMVFLVAASAADAQSSLRISGILGVGVASVWGGEQGASSYAGGRVLKLATDSKVPSRLVFRGAEDLGGGMSAIFILDKGINVDDGTETLGGAFRESYVGLKSNFGTVTLGRQFHPLFNVRDNYDPTADSSNLMASAGFRMNNSVMYLTPTFSGFYAKIAYGFGEATDSNTSNRATGAYIGYDNGPFSTMLGYNRLNDATGQQHASNVLWSASYNFNVASAYIEYGFNKGSVGNGVFADADNKDLLVGVKVPFGVQSLAATYVLKRDDLVDDADAHQVQLLYTYSLSKRTTLYAKATKISNDRNARYTVAAAPNAPTAAQGALGARAFDKEFTFGIRHSF